jgi:PAS domain S-box-containing protein
MRKGFMPSSLDDLQRYRLLIESVIDYAIFMLDPEGHVTTWNPGAARFKGYSEAEILGQHFSRFYTEPDRASGLPARALATAAHKGSFEHEGWRVRKDGTRFWANVVIDSIRAPSGELLGFAKITRDLTERKLAEDALRQSEEQFRLLVQGVVDYAIYMLDTEGRVTNWNSGAERIKGYTADEILGRHFSCFYLEEDIAAGIPEQALATALREGKYEKESLRRRKDGTRFWAHVVIDPIRDASGRHIGFAKITRDVTARRATEEALAETRARLTQSQKLEAIGQLTGGIAHDFNNLLTAVLGSLALLRKRLPDDPKLTRLIDNALAGAQRGANLTQRLLAFARRQDLQPQPLDLIDLVRGMSELMQSSASGVRIETQFPLRLGRVLGDANQLELAILNLVINARDAMPEGGTITLQGREETVAAQNPLGLEAGDYVRFAVVDTGEGMDADTLSRATEPFFTTKGVGRGTGLGLSMVHGIAEQSGGSLQLKSRKGEGTTAEIWLRRAPRAPLDAPAPADAPGHEHVPPPLAPMIVLVVDDDPLVLQNAAAMLDDLGHHPLEAPSGAKALGLLRARGDVDLVITDQVMPEMTGLELANAIKAEWPDLPVLLATGYAELPANRALDLPKLAKPFGQDVLAQALVHALSRPADAVAPLGGRKMSSSKRAPPPGHLVHPRRFRRYPPRG